MEYFQDKFFHSVWEANYGPNKVETNSPYCKYDSQTLQLFQSCLYIAGIHVGHIAFGHAVSTPVVLPSYVPICVAMHVSWVSHLPSVLAALFAALSASYIAKWYGRKMCFILAGIAYLIGSGLTTGAVAKSSGLAMLIIGRCSLGVGVGFANSVSLPERSKA